MNRLAALCLLASGAAALMYEVLWSRCFALVMGHTAYALAAVLSAFLLGLGLGAWLSGRWTRSRRARWKHYALLEIGIAAFGLAMPSLLDLASPLFGLAYRRFGADLATTSFVQLLIALPLIAVPTMLMGATLPIVVAILRQGARGFGATTAWLYAANTLGGGAGAALCGFWLLPALGLAHTALFAVAANLLAALLAGVAMRRAAEDGEAPAAEPPSRIASGVPAAPWLAGVCALSGFAALALQVGWVRLVSLSIGSTTYGFTIALVSYICGLGLGSALVPHVAVACRRPRAAAAVLNATVGVWSFATLGILGALPLWVIRLTGSAELGFTELLVRELLLVAATIVIPTAAMGALFPVMATLVRQRVAAPGAAVGTVFAASTAGNVLGAVVAGFVLVPLIGMRGTILVAAALSLLAAAALVLPGLRLSPERRVVASLAAGGAILLCWLVSPSWDRAIITSGPYLHARFWSEQDRNEPGVGLREIVSRGNQNLVDYAEGASAIVSVTRRGTALHLQVGGYTDAVSGGSTQSLIAHLPLLLHPDPRRVLVVGLGGGTTLGRVLMYPIASADCVEISPEVRDMARRHFQDFTGGALRDHRAHVIIGDGRNHLRHARTRYDVITSQPSMPWVSGAAGLFTRDCFEEMRQRLAPGGLACIWYQSWARDGRDLRSVVAAWSAVFPQSWLLTSRFLGEYVLLGGDAAGRVSARELGQRMSRAEVAEDLATCGLLEPADLLGMILLDPPGIRAISAGVTANTDDNGLVEFAAPTGMLSRDPLGELDALHQHRAGLAAILDRWGPSFAENPGLSDRLEAIHSARDLVLRCRHLEAAGGPRMRWRTLLEEAARLDPRNPYVRRWKR
jgi:spermidine synthase